MIHRYGNWNSAAHSLRNGQLPEHYNPHYEYITRLLRDREGSQVARHTRWYNSVQWLTQRLQKIYASTAETLQRWTNRTDHGSFATYSTIWRGERLTTGTHGHGHS